MKRKKAKIRKRVTEKVVAYITEHLLDDSKQLPHWNRWEPARYALCAAVEAAYAARELAVRKALGQKVKPIGYFIHDDEISDDEVRLLRNPDGGVTIDY